MTVSAIQQGRQTCVSVRKRPRATAPDASEPAKNGRVNASKIEQLLTPDRFAHTFDESSTNDDIFDKVVLAKVSEVVENGTAATFFAYGHTGSGKTHTIFGYEDEGTVGISLLAAKAMLDHASASAHGHDQPLGLGIRMFELRGNSAFDLLNDHTECFIRQGPDGTTHIRGETEKLSDGRVRVRGIKTLPVWDWDQAKRVISSGLKKRSVGNSTVHELSSRTHAVLELEIVNRALLDARDEVVEREAELVPVGKAATDIYMEEQWKSLVKDENTNQYIPNPEYTINQDRIDRIEAQKAECEARVENAKSTVNALLSQATFTPRLGAKMIFVDLAGAEFNSEPSSGHAGARPTQSAAEKRATRQINTDLMALKDVVRAISQRLPRIPFRASPLTMVMREHFERDRSRTGTENENGKGDREYSAENANVIVTISSDDDQSLATLNTLRFATSISA